MKAKRLLAENINALLRARSQTQHDLAQWCFHKDAWLSYFLAGKRGILLKDLDRIADFFGLATYQLFQPGIARSTERRSGLNRRSGEERRKSDAQRFTSHLRSALEGDIQSGHTPKAEAGHGGRPVPSAAALGRISRHLAALAAQLSDVDPDPAGAQPRRPVSKTRARKTKSG